MQLLKITSVPLEYEIHTEAARLEMKQAQNPSHVMTKNPSGWTMHARNIQVRMDTTELRASLNMRNSMDFARYYGSQGRQAAYQAVGDAADPGWCIHRTDYPAAFAAAAGNLYHIPAVCRHRYFLAACPAG